MTLQLLATGFGQPEIAAMLKYDVDSYVVRYMTEYKGERLEASGVIMIPSQMDSDASIVSVQHGTLFSKDEAPSVSGGLQGVEFFASAGYIAILPDFLGYGASDESAGSKNVSLTLLPGKGHGNGFESMLRDFIPWFLTR